MNSPVQIVLNAQDYVRNAENPPGGSNTDFYAGEDVAFVRHQKKLQSEIKNLRQMTQKFEPNEIFYAQVDLQNVAWAKSHRPVKKIFTPHVVSHVTGSSLGSIIVELTAESLTNIETTIGEAEPNTNWVIKNGKKEAKPTRIRSEVGAIQSVRLYAATDRRRFSIEQALNWLADDRAGSSYYIETFLSEKSIAERQRPFQRAAGHIALKKFAAELENLDLPVRVSHLSEHWTTSSLFIVTVNMPHDASRTQMKAVHTSLLSFLETQTIVRSILLPPILQAAKLGGKRGGAANLPKPANQLANYPLVGVIDSGVSPIRSLRPWTAGRSGMVFPVEQDTSHGTFIAGLICGADTLNVHEVFQEEKCAFYDLGLHPTSGNYSDYYPRGFIDFLEQLDVELSTAKTAGVRIFNMSLAVTTPVEDFNYSIFATLIDEISDRHDVLFVLPAGNLEANISRDEWPDKASEAIEMLANYPHSGRDKIYQPADSIRSLVIGAVNPPNDGYGCLPARYTRRGPGPSLGMKPDLCHVGGKLGAESGLCSLDETGALLHDCGTSFAAPLAAKTAATINHQTGGRLTREALIALLIHHAAVPESLKVAKLKKIARDFVGAGIPRVARETLLNSESEITLMFSGILLAGQELRFQFAWPQSLVNKDGGCSGTVRLTMVHRPPIDRSHAGEYVRVNLDAFLRQEEVDKKTGEVKFKGSRIKNSTPTGLEKELINHGSKWWPIKQAEGTLDQIGHSSQWRIIVESLCRSDYNIPQEGIPFTVILTISDDLGLPIFNEMRQQLQSSGVNIGDVRAEVRPRIIR